MTIQVECGSCGGHGMGNQSPRCPKCKGKGGFDVETSDPEWIEWCDSENLNPETGDDFENDHKAALEFDRNFEGL